MNPAKSKNEVKIIKPEGPPRTREALPSGAGPSDLQNSSLKDEARRCPMRCPLSVPLPLKPPSEVGGTGEELP